MILIYVVCILSYTLPTYTMQCIAAITNVGWGLAYILYMCSYISLQETTHSLYISCPWVGVAVHTRIQYSDVTVRNCTQQMNSEDIVLRYKIGRHAMLRTVTKTVLSSQCVEQYIYCLWHAHSLHGLHGRSLTIALSQQHHNISPPCIILRIACITRRHIQPHVVMFTVTLAILRIGQCQPCLNICVEEV